MLNKTRGIVLNYTDYSESSIVVKIYTELFGTQSYLVNSVRTKKAKVKIAMFQPLTLVEMEVYHKNSRGIQRFSEIRTSPALGHIPYDVVKSAIAFFLAEVLYKSLKEEEANSSVFEFVYNAIQILDVSNDSCSNFHIQFLAHLCKYLGFMPNDEYAADTPFFNLREGTYQASEPPHSFFMGPGYALQFSRLLNTPFNDATLLNISGADRRVLLQKIICFYELQLTNWGQLKSMQIMQEVLS